jgi:hypothetical protein
MAQKPEVYMAMIRRNEMKEPMFGAAYDLQQRLALANYGVELFLYSFEQSKREEQGS